MIGVINMAKVKKTYKKEELLNISPAELSKKSKEELRYIVSSMDRMISRQYTQLQKSADKIGDIPALKAIEKQGIPKILNENGELKSRNELLSEASKGYRIFGLKTYTVKEAKNVRGKVDKRIEDYFKDLGQVTKETKDKFWESYNKFKELVGAQDYVDSERVQEEISNYMVDKPNQSADEVAIGMLDWFDKEYEAYQDRLEMELQHGLSFYNGGSNI